ncbi:hydrolase [Novosphingobium sp. PC22D]|uniref:HAD family hydrolase n=1 Tax=Novosphingobium sp. PC22D TaxID=1962403 RepID=UPI000BEF300D|nr:HAD family phosphatase [Novosphingobium sp. PC22D]PEQ12013.1 hydrolase [Novosphingobium sp. PC22D]
MSDSIKAVVFDVGRVLIRWDLRALYAKLIDDPAQLEWFVTHVVTEDWHFEHDAGRDLDEMVAERKLQFPAFADLIDAYATRFLESIPGPVEGTHEIVRRLDARGVPLFAITNFATPFWAEFRPTDPLFERFRDIVVSGDEKVAKPAARIYEIAASRFGFAPADMLFIDDNPANVAAARALGWHVHQFHDAATLEADLRERALL